jgi:hypothetical protein
LTLNAKPARLSNPADQAPPVFHRMRVLAILPDDSYLALKRALGPRDAVGRFADMPALLRMLASTHADAIVVDPAGLDAEGWARARDLLSTQAPVLLYARLDQESVTRIVAASAIGAHEVLLRDLDDDPVAMRRKLESLLRPAAPSRVLSRLAGRLGELPPSLQGAAVPLFCAAPVPRWADDLARSARMSRRSVDRWMGHAGLSGTATLLDVARLARTWIPLVEQGVPAADVALNGGYRRLRMLALHTRRLVGASPSLMGREISEDQFVDRLVGHALRS